MTDLANPPRLQDDSEVDVLAVDALSTGTPLDHYWSRVVGAGRAHEALRADWQDHLTRAVADCGFEYVRFHGLFHDDMFVYRIDADGNEIFNFQYVDAVFDRLLGLGIRPFVEFGFSPGDLAREKNTVFWWNGHGSPPKDYDAWQRLITRTLEHWVARYGINELTHWYFEVWNEPNLDPFFRGTRSEYLQLYAVSAQAVKAVDSRLRVGGPATSNFVADQRFAGETEDVTQHIVAGPDTLDQLDWNPVWVEAFLEFAAERGLPVDFVSCHPYPTDWALDEHGRGAKLTRNSEATPSDLRKLRRLIDASAFPDAELHLTEWNSSSSSRDHTHDQLPAATFIAKAVNGGLGQVDSLAYWTFTDVFEEVGAGDELFHGGFGLITLPGVVKPTFHAYRMLHRLGDTLLGRTTFAVASRHSRSGQIAILAYHYPPEVDRSVPASFDNRQVADLTARTGSPRRLELDLTNLAPGSGVFTEILDATHGNAIEAWRRMGSPSAPTREQLDQLRMMADSTHLRTAHADRHGRLRLQQDLAPWSICLITAVANRTS
ncbi:hypothetical protein ABZS29_17760 [Kribbella sp. NPDC005582]|uniref:GH39 family glycosyl hydrolase n=1 Tax=Kribbella sp. NPDC005582 TaxID=3156893 RepID=UPI0033AF6685